VKWPDNSDTLLLVLILLIVFPALSLVFLQE
jgi:hypothetical protein